MSAERIEEQAALWLLRREDESWAPEDQKALDDWLDQSMAHKASFWRLEHAWRMADRVAVVRTEPAIPPAGRQLPAARRWMPIGGAIAAITCIAMFAGIAERIRGGDDRAAQVAHSLRTEVGGYRLVSLADGSSIELNTDTALRQAVDKRARRVWLDHGEAYFQVAHADKLPFVVYAGTRTVTVLGTKFLVRHEGQKVTVSVVEGRVQITPRSDAASASSSIITVGDVATIDGARMTVEADGPAQVANQLAWRGGKLTFDQSTLQEAASEFNRYNGVKLMIVDPRVSGMRIGGTFRASNVDAFARLLRDAYGLHVEFGAHDIKVGA